MTIVKGAQTPVPSEPSPPFTLIWNVYFYILFAIGTATQFSNINLSLASLNCSTSSKTFLF